MTVRIGNVQLVQGDGGPRLLVEVDGRLADIYWEQKLYEDFGAIFLGSAFERDYQITIPADHPNNEKPWDRTFEGFVIDEQLGKIFEEYAERL